MPVRKVEFAVLVPLCDGTPLLEHVTKLTPIADLVLPVSTTKAIGALLAEHRHATKLQDHGLRPANRVLFCGPPGTGKTVTAGAVALELGIPFVVVRQDVLIQQYLGQTSKALRLVFEFAKTNRAVILIDEADAITRARPDRDHDTSGADAEMSRVMTSLLVMLEEQREHSQCLIIAATNHEGVIDQALWRRFDEVVQFQMPDELTGTMLMSRILRRHGYSLAAGDKITAGAITKSVRGMSFADIERVTLSAIKHATIDEGTTISGALLEAMLTQRERVSLTRKQNKRSKR